MGRYNLDGKVGLVTGAARGIGFAIARRLLDEGCHVILNDIDEEALKSARERLGGDERHLRLIVADVAAREPVRALFQRIREWYGGVDLLVNNAAMVTRRRWLPEYPESFFEQVLHMNVTAVYLCSRAAAAQMARRGGGAIVNMSSVGAARSFRGSVPYVTSKGAVEAQTRALALDLAPYRIRVNAIGPGMIATEAWDGVAVEEVERRRGVVPLGREGRPEDVAAATLFLLSTEASYITGQILYVDGGLLSQCYSPGTEMPHFIAPPPENFQLVEDVEAALGKQEEEDR